MMVVKNNYYWLDEDHEAGFLANGDLVEVLKINEIKKIYGFQFAFVLIKMLDYRSKMR